MQSERISLIICGMMGSGKTTTGKILADELNLPFYDLDQLIEHETGIPIPDIFLNHGEDEFRRIEKELLMARSQNMNGVLALGGGALQHQHILDHLKLAGWLIYLKAPAEVLYQRLKKSEGRPMLAGQYNEELFHRIDKLLKIREPLYNQAHITIHTEGLQPKQVAKKIIQKLNNYDAFPRS